MANERPAQDATEFRVREALKAHRRGWALTPLNGKVPRVHKWNELPFPTEEQVEVWARAGNVGLRTGEISGVFVVDEDTLKGGAVAEITGFDPPPITPSVITGGGGWHFYFRAPKPCPGNSANRLASHVDTRGEGGQVVFVGSIHPVTSNIYQWAPGLSPDDVELAELPAGVLEQLVGSRRREPAPEEVPATSSAASRYLAEAIRRESEAVASAIEGERNHTLNRAAFSLGQLVAGGELSESEVTAALASAARAAGLEDAEIRATIASGLRAGAGSPRRAPERPATGATVRRGPWASRDSGPAPETSERDEASSPDLPPAKPRVLVPGAYIAPDGEVLEIGHDVTADEVLRALPEGILYRRADIPGEIVGEPGTRRFRALSVARLRCIVDEHVFLYRWRTSKAEGSTEVVPQYVPCGRDIAHVILDAAISHPSVRELRYLLPYPTAHGSGLEITAPGWNASVGAYYDEPPELRDLSLDLPADRCLAILHDLVVDFPFANPASRDNFLGLLVTPLVRPALEGNVPLHLINSPLERTGKSKLAELVLGQVLTGAPTPAMQLSGTEDERDKRVLSILLDGAPICHLDNVREFLDSATLASLLTSRVFASRRLGTNERIRVPVDLVMVATGNNVRATGEIVKRTIPIELQPQTDAPEQRTDFRHPNLPDYLATVRPSVVSALLSMINAWRDAGRELGPDTLGGFEEWAGIVGGILAQAGVAQHLRNLSTWRQKADPQGEELRAFAALWAERYLPGISVTAKQLLELASEADLFSDVLRHSNDAGNLTAFSRRILARHIDAPVGRWIIRRYASGRNTSYTLENNLHA